MASGNKGNIVIRKNGWILYAFGVSIYVLATLLTDAFFMGDSADYVDSIIAHQNGEYYHFWEFGHLLWRPLGWAVVEILKPVTSGVVGPFPRAGVFLSLIWINWAAGLLCVICLVYFLKLFCKNVLIIGMTISGFIFSQGVLNYAQTGLSYVPGLAFLMLGICYMAQENFLGKNHNIKILAAGISFGTAVGFWFLYVWALPAAIFLPLILHGANRERAKFVFAVGGMSVAVTGLIYMVPIAVLRISNFSALKDWILDAGHSMAISGFSRLALGIVRTFINLGNDGMLMKRFLVGDIYNPVSVSQLILSSLWKVALFYFFLLTIVWMLTKAKNGSRLFLMLAATAPIFIFAYFFSPSDIERYMAWYPFFFLLVAYAVENTTAPNWARIFPIVILLVVVTSNGRAMFTPTLLRQQEKILDRLGELPSKTPPYSRVFAVNWQDELVNFQRTFPFHPLNKNGLFTVSSLVTPGVVGNKYWREDFANNALRTWKAGGEVWLSARALKQHPEASWNWVEGDDKNISWKEFPDFFAKIELGAATGGSDGFYLILPSEVNKKYLQEIIDQSNFKKTVNF